MPKHIAAPNAIAFLAAVALAVTVCGCAPNDENRTTTGSNAAGEGSNGTTVAQTQRAGSTESARDLGTFDLCALVPVADVASTLGHELSSGSAKATMGQWATDCTYSFGRGDGSSDYVMIWAYPPQLWAPEAKGEIEEVAGLGDRAFLSSSGSFAQANVLLAGDLYLDTRADTPNRARALAELAIARLTAMGGER